MQRQALSKLKNYEERLFSVMEVFFGIICEMDADAQAREDDSEETTALQILVYEGSETHGDIAFFRHQLSEFIEKVEKQVAK